MEHTILVVDDHEAIIRGVEKLLRNNCDFKIVGTALDASHAMDLARECSPEIVLMDLILPDSDGIKATRDILSLIPSAKIIAFSGYQKRELVLGSLQAGARGYLCKGSPLEYLVLAMKAVCEDKIFLDPAISSMIIDIAFDSTHSKSRHSTAQQSYEDTSSSFTNRESSFIALLIKGHTMKEIASELGISLKTTYKVKNALLKKCNSSSVAELVKVVLMPSRHEE